MTKDYDRFESYTGNGAFSGSPSASYNFVMRVEGVYNVPLKSIRSFTKKNSYETIQEGGLNDYVHIKRKQNTEIFQLQVERYVSAHVLDPFANGAVLTLPLILAVYKGNIGDAHICKTYIFTGVEVMGKEYGELNAERSGLATETITLSFQEMFTIPNLADLGGDQEKQEKKEKPKIPLKPNGTTVGTPVKKTKPKLHGGTAAVKVKRSAKKITTRTADKRVKKSAKKVTPKLHGGTAKLIVKKSAKKIETRTADSRVKKSAKKVTPKLH